MTLASLCQQLLPLSALPPHPAGHAAVAALLLPRCGDVEVLLIRRAERAGDPWSGHIALPGGRCEAGESWLRTAQRETQEEIGLDLTRHGHCLGTLPLVRPQWRDEPLHVAPIVFALRDVPALQPAPSEVEELLWVPLALLASGEVESRYELRLGQTLRSFPAWQWEDRVVWGMTYRILHDLLDRLALAAR